MRFSEENVELIWNELFPLLSEAHEESGLTNLKLNPDLNTYIQLQKNGILHVVVARDEQSKIVGYSGFTIAAHHQYMNYRVAQQESFFVKK